MNLKKLTNNQISKLYSIAENTFGIKTDDNNKVTT